MRWPCILCCRPYAARFYFPLILLFNCPLFFFCFTCSYQVTLCGDTDEDHIIANADFFSFGSLLGSWMNCPPARFSFNYTRWSSRNISDCLSVCSSVCHFVCFSMSICLSACLSICLSVCLSFNLTNLRSFLVHQRQTPAYRSKNKTRDRRDTKDSWLINGLG